MKRFKLAALGAVIIFELAAGTPAQAAQAPEDFEFVFSPSMLVNEDGREGLRQNLARDARDHCRDNLHASPSLQQVSQCNRVLVREALRQLAERYPDTGDVLMREE